jgi:hypothetical protein
VHATDQYIGNPDPEVDPARGQLASKSLPSQLAEVPNSEDDDVEMPVGNLHPAMQPTEAEATPHPGVPPISDVVYWRSWDPDRHLWIV